MTAPASTLANQAEELLASPFAPLQEPTVKLAAFRTRHGRQLGLMRLPKRAIFVWAECHDAALAGVCINNQKRPGQAYSPEQSRSAAINTQCKNLSVGNRSYYLKCDTLGALERFASWYDGV